MFGATRFDPGIIGLALRWIGNVGKIDLYCIIITGRGMTTINKMHLSNRARRGGGLRMSDENPGSDPRDDEDQG